MTTDAVHGTTRWMEPVLLAAVAAVIFVADQATKALVAGGIVLNERVSVVGDLVQLWHVRNSGAAFSLFQGGTLLFLVVTVVAIGMIVYFHRIFRGRSPWLQVLLGVILGGTAGNLVDRLRFGYVTDFLSIGVGDVRWPVFNVADSSVVVGIGLLVIYLFVTDRGRREIRA
ncbi:MAG: signal peptidase II [Chloroflexota bacterium]